MHLLLTGSQMLYIYLSYIYFIVLHDKITIAPVDSQPTGYTTHTRPIDQSSYEGVEQ